MKGRGSEEVALPLPGGRELTLPMDWPEAVRQEVRTAFADGKPSQVSRALAALESLSTEVRGRPLRIAIASTFTLRPQLATLELALATFPARPLISIGAPDVIEQALLDPGSPLLAGEPQAVLVLWRLEELHLQLVEEGAGWSADDRARATHEVVTRIRALADTFCSRSAAPIFLSTLPPIVDGLDGDVTNLHGSHGLRTTLLSINLEILRLAEKHTRVHVFDFAGWAAQFGEECFDRRLDLFARQPIAAKALSSFALALRRALRPLACARLKVLALDLDNTLWAGTLEEDGIAGLRIGHEFPGNAYRKIQQRAKALKRQGVILVLLTRNDESEVRRAFTELPDMPLTLDDFVAMKANWRPKHENLREVMADLNLGIDSVVFLDDQGFEREEMRWRAPEVHVLEASGPLGLLRALESTDLFDTFEIGDEDHARTDYYAAERERRALGATHEGSRDGFLASLRLKAEIQPVTEGSLGRVVQMLAKTNQFNLTTRRHSEADVRRMLRGPGNILRTVAVSDRFGDLGIVGVVIALADAPANALRIDSFLLSCRAMERGVEDALWADLLAQGALAGVHCLTAEYVPTPKNGHVSALYDRLGMTLVSDVAGRRAYQLILPTRRNAPDWIFIRGGSP